MQSAGDEKKIQALFRELKLADERVAPEFIKVLDRAQEAGPPSWRLINLSFAVATALLVITVSVLALWSRNAQPSEQANSKVATEATRPGSTPGPTSPPPATAPAPAQFVVTQSPVRVKSNRWDWRFAARRRADHDARDVVIQEAVSISSWQSPTATLMRSPADDVLTALPQLDRSVTELKTFLPNTAQ